MNSKLKVLHIISKKDIPLCMYFLQRFLGKLNKEGVAVDLIVLGGKDSEKSIFPSEVSVQYFSGNFISNFFRLLSYTRSENFACVHSHHVNAQCVSAWAALLCGKKSINTIYAPVDRKYFGYMVNLNIFNVFISKYVCSKFLSFHHISPKKIKIIYSGVDTSMDDFDKKMDQAKDVKRKLGFKEDDFLISNFSRLEIENDQTSLLKAFKKLRQKEFDGYLLLNAVGSNRLQTEKVISNLGLGDHIRFIEHEDLAILPIVDAYIDSGFHDNWRDHILKIMNLGRAVITTKIAAHPEIIEDGQSGYLVPCGFPERIESAIMRLKVNQALVTKIKNQAQARVSEQFSLDKSADDYLQLYRGTTSGH